jgi:hypothetical protein
MSTIKLGKGVSQGSMGEEGNSYGEGEEFLQAEFWTKRVL